MRSTVGERISAQNSWSRKTVSPSLRQSWNQSRQVMRLPVQLWKYSCAITRSMAEKLASVAVSGEARIRASLKMLRPLFSIAPMLKSETATTLNTLKSYSRPKRSSSQRMERLSESMAQAQRPSLPGST